MSIFGNSTQNTGGSSLFGGGQQNTNSGGGGGGLFGSSTQQNTNTGGGLFGQSNSGGSSLFGGGQQQQQQPQQQQQNAGGSLFGQSNAGGSLFGGGGQQQQQQQQQNQGPSLFGGNNQQQTQQQNQNQNQNNSSFASSQPAPQNSTFPGFNPLASGSAFPPGLTLTQQQDLARSRLSQAGLNPTERGIVSQTKAVLRKWDPNSQDTLLQAYLYNAVSAAYAPFYHPQKEEREDEWERALQAAPKLEGPENDGTKMVPVLVRGFKALGERVEYQANFVNSLRARLHEMNNSLSAIISAHQERISVGLEERRRQHSALRERTLRLSVKVQVLRNRGYALDAQEEALRKQLLALSASVSDPTFAGREEEIWARMVALRDRARWLEEETKRVGGAAQEQQGQGQGSKVPAHVLDKTQKILRDYDGQLRHLGGELEEVRKEFEEWETSQQNGRR
ncbi:hypothetical protein B0A50_08309 [Salinomyces thailandicus]|uniref:Nucleoporin Nup54 alpha-helical domain-containing protein n=1 Tax=Salinomyces thailandicus TaxID=706561 RepID=A0A4U0TK90_9PEZI|nr:hypothetical protein B0A50_08309 [Salinomyces thailandica]